MHFERMIRNKYGISKKNFENMGYEERNKRLREMLKNDGIVVVPDDKPQFTDQLPQIKILSNNLKTIIGEDPNQLGTCPTSPLSGSGEANKRQRMVRKPKVDMGIPPRNQGEEATARAGGTFDPKNFKGNAMLFRYLNDVNLSMCRQKFQQSEATKMKKTGQTGGGQKKGKNQLQKDEHVLSEPDLGDYEGQNQLSLPK